MTFRLFDAPQAEPSQFVGFAGNTIDRQSENRSDDSVEKALANPAARLLLMGGGRILLKLGNGRFRRAISPLPRHRRSAPSLDNAILLGFTEAGPFLRRHRAPIPRRFPT